MGVAQQRKEYRYSPQRAGPFEIVKRYGPLAYELNLPSSWKINPVMSVTQLYRPAQGEDPFDRAVMEAEPIILEGQKYRMNNKLREHRVNWRGNSSTVDYFVRWKDFAVNDDSWVGRDKILRTRKGRPWKNTRSYTPSI